MRHPGDVSALDGLIAAGALRAGDVVAIIGKTEGNGGVNDFTRGYFTQSLMALLALHTGEAAEALQARIPCVLSGGTEGVLSPHYLVFSRARSVHAPHEHGAGAAALAVGVAMSAPMAAEDIGRASHIRSVAQAVRRAMDDAHIASAAEVRLVQVKCPTVTAAGAQEAAARGRVVISTDPNRAMAHARVAGAFGVALALGELRDDPETLAEAALVDFGRFSPRASISSGVEVRCNEVIVLGHSSAWTGPLRIACRPMADALDIGAVFEACAELGLPMERHQLTPEAAARVAGVLVKCEPDRRGRVRGHRHTMLDDIDINAQRHIRGALGGLVAGVLGDGRLFVSGGAEHQGPDGGGLVALIAHQAHHTDPADPADHAHGAHQEQQP